MLLAACQQPLEPVVYDEASLLNSASQPAASGTNETDSRNIFYLDKGWLLVGMSQAEFTEIWELANLSARVYEDLWDSALASIAPYLLPSLDFSTNSRYYVHIKSYDCPSGFHAQLFRDTRDNAYTLVYRGTNALSITDWVNNLMQGLADYTDIPAPQYDEAISLVRLVRTEYPRLKRIVGHSLGGGLAQLAALDQKLPATCFNAAGLTKATLTRWNIGPEKLAANQLLITHYNVRYDPLSDPFGLRNGEAPIPSTRQYGGKTYWLRNLSGSGLVINPLRIANHFYHAYVYQLYHTYRFTGNFM